ncbi:MAG: hypothetical protein AAFV80_16560, partial [Bacteroidota bacterium]
MGTQEGLNRFDGRQYVPYRNKRGNRTKDGLQAEYNKAIQHSDIFISLFATKVGKYTQEEFET